ncbi:histidine phosphatase family protein [Buttiauxella sp. S04-F03]|uniref:histidine phosphatase family protein n=1 Tax=Buttiauxella sp. W03-F01 TaxID=2904524 RepID=UPI001E3CC374|nr:histidine phosphatase family protein [Buttiauxella sp. W03-F01]MCE0801183.1 histidine phosphatase family protein [Buttiauxella sp. W03-F01]
MEIILMHHGKPTYTGSPKVTSREMADWIEQYNISDTGNDTPPESSKLLSSCTLQIISSPLPRALSSLRALGYEPGLIDEVFREVDLIPCFRLSPTCWAVLFRAIWLCGMSSKTESLGKAKKRAFQGAEILINVANKFKGTVLLMGHGVMNELIARELISLGWKKQSRSGKGNWKAFTNIIKYMLNEFTYRIGFMSALACS